MLVLHDPWAFLGLPWSFPVYSFLSPSSPWTLAPWNPWTLGSLSPRTLRALEPWTLEPGLVGIKKTKFPGAKTELISILKNARFTGISAKSWPWAFLGLPWSFPIYSFLNPWTLESLNPWKLEPLNPWTLRALNPWTLWLLVQAPSFWHLLGAGHLLGANHLAGACLKALCGQGLLEPLRLPSPREGPGRVSKTLGFRVFTFVLPASGMAICGTAVARLEAAQLHLGLCVTRFLVARWSLGQLRALQGG